MTIRARISIATCSMLAFFALAAPASAQTKADTDLRDVRVGMAVADLPREGYADFSCADDPKRTIESWTGWRDCPANASGLHALRYGYDKETDREGVIVAGHPAVLTIYVDKAGDVAGLRIETDPKARLYLRKKAFLFGLQVKARYGKDGWTCTQKPPEGAEQAIGETFVKERCTKSGPGRDIVFERNMYRLAGSAPRDFVDDTRMTIMRSKP